MRQRCRRISGGVSDDALAGQAHEDGAPLLESGVDPSRLIVVTGLEAFGREESSALGKLAGATVALAGGPVAEVQNSFGTMGDGGVDHPPDLGLGGIHAVTERHGMEEVPEGDARCDRVLAHRFEVLEVLAAGIVTGPHERIVVHRQHVRFHRLHEIPEVLVVGVGPHLAGGRVVGK